MNNVRLSLAKENAQLSLRRTSDHASLDEGHLNCAAEDEVLTRMRICVNNSCSRL